jgi:ribosomal protein S26
MREVDRIPVRICQLECLLCYSTYWLTDVYGNLNYCEECAEKFDALKFQNATRRKSTSPADEEQDTGDQK